MNNMNNRIDNYKFLKNAVFEVANSLRGVVYSSQLAFSLLRLFFLKYSVDNFVGADNIDSMRIYAEAQKAFATRDLEAGFSITRTVLECIDAHYNFYSIFSGPDNVENYSRELFGTVAGTQSVKRTATDEQYKSIVAKLAAVDLKEPSDDHEIGKALVTIFYDQILDSSYRSSYSAEFTTSESLAKIAGAILDVKKDDLFCDFTSGIGMSTISITKDTVPAVVCIEKDRTAAAASAMFLIVWGYEDFNVYSEDSLGKPAPGGGGNKIFVDPPINSKLESMQGSYSGKVDSVVLAVDRIINNYLYQDGIAVVAVPGRFLFQNAKSVWMAKAELVRKEYLQAMIALPPLWSGTNIGTNLLVISKKRNRGVTFIDASNQGTKIKSSPLTVVLDDTISMIMSNLNDPGSNHGISEFVFTSTIEEHDFDLVPATYIKKLSNEDNTTLEEIEKQLTELYSQLNS